MFGVWSTVSRECKKVCMGKACMHGRANPQGMKCQRVGPNEILCRHLVTRLCFCARRNGYTSYDYILAHSVDGYSLCVSDVKSLWKLVLMQDTKIWNWRSRSHVYIFTDESLRKESNLASDIFADLSDFTMMKIERYNAQHSQ